MDPLPRYRHLLGFRHDRAGESLNDFTGLQELFPTLIPLQVQEFLTSLADCVLYYSFDVPTRSGNSKRYSHFVTTNIGPELDSVHPFPASLIGRIVRFRSMGLPDSYLPFMMDTGRTCWLWCDLSQVSPAIVVAKGTREFGVAAKEWTVIASSWDDFLQGMRLDVSPLLSAFRLAGTANVQPSMRAWLVAALGEDWDTRIQELIRAKRQKPA